MTLLGIRSGDRVTIRTAHGQERTGRVVMAFRAHVVLNLGGPHGTPGVGTADNIVRVRSRRMSQAEVRGLEAFEATIRG